MQRRKTAAEVFPLIKLVEEDKLTREDFCNRTGLKESSFLYWRQKYRNQERSEGKFLPISQVEMVGGDHVMEVEFGSGVKLRFSSLVPVEYLNQIIHQR